MVDDEVLGIIWRDIQGRSMANDSNGRDARRGDRLSLSVVLVATSLTSMLVGASLAILARSSPTVAVVAAPNPSGAVSPAANDGLLSLLLGNSATRADETAATAPREEKDDLLITPEILAAERDLIDRSLAPDFVPIGFVEDPASAPVWKKLRERSITASVPAGLSLEAAVAGLAKEAGADIEINWACLGEVGLAPEMTLAPPLRAGTNLQAALKRVLEAVVSSPSGTAPTEQITFDVEDGVVIVTTKSCALRKQATFVYEVWDLLTCPQSPNVIRAADSWIWWGDRYEEQIKQLIFDEVDANWEERGAGSDRIAEFGLNLVITTSPVAHREIMVLLEKLRFGHRRRMLRWH
jgi:hypothetical protein